MDRHVKLYQEGGVTMLPYVTYEPDVDEPAASASKGSSSSDLTDKDLLDMLDKLDGLPSDMGQIVSKLKNFNTGLLGGSGFLSGRSRNTASRYIDILNDIKVANFNKKEYDNAYKKASKNGALEETAIDQGGRMICVNAEGDFKWMTPEVWKDKMEEYQPLSNSELLYYRAQDPSMANQNSVLSVVQMGIGMSDVNKYIDEAFQKLASTEASEEGYFGMRAGQLVQGYNDYVKAVRESSGSGNFDGTVQELYKYKYLTKDQANQAAACFAYVYQTMPENMKSLLKVKSDCSETGAQTLLQEYVSSKVDDKKEFDIDKVNAKSGDGSGSGAATGEIKDTQLVEMVKNVNGVKQQMTVDRGDGIQMSLLGRKFNLVYDTDNKYIGNTSLSHMISASGIQNICRNMMNITFGDQKVDPDMLDRITYNNTGVMRCNLPINPDGSVKLEVLEAYERCEKQVDELGQNPDPQKIIEIYQKEGLADLLDANGRPNPNKFAPFLVTEGYTTDALTGIEPSKFVKPVENGGNAKQIANLIERCLAVDNELEMKTKVDTMEWWKPGDWFGLYDKIYRAAIYIPIDDNVALAARTDKQNIPYSTAVREKKKQDDAPKIRNYFQGSASPDLLKNNS